MNAPVTLAVVEASRLSVEEDRGSATSGSIPDPVSVAGVSPGCRGERGHVEVRSSRERKQQLGDRVSVEAKATRPPASPQLGARRRRPTGGGRVAERVSNRIGCSIMSPTGSALGTLGRVDVADPVLVRDGAGGEAGPCRRWRRRADGRGGLLAARTSRAQRPEARTSSTFCRIPVYEPHGMPVSGRWSASKATWQLSVSVESGREAGDLTDAAPRVFSTGSSTTSCPEGEIEAVMDGVVRGVGPQPGADLESLEHQRGRGDPFLRAPVRPSSPSRRRARRRSRAW